MEVESVSRYAALGLIDVDGTGEFSDEDIRRIQVFQTLEQAGLPIDGVAALINSGRLSLDFIEAAGQYVFVPLSDRTFVEVSKSTGLSVDGHRIIGQLLMAEVRAWSTRIPMPAPVQCDDPVSSAQAIRERGEEGPVEAPPR